MFPPKRLDLGWADLLAGLAACAARHDRQRLAARVEQRWSPAGDAIACLSVRSALDLYLGALALPRGSEVLVSALTIPDMLRILEHHGLVPVPVDLDVATLAPDARALAAAVGPATRAVIVAHLFGSRAPLAPVLALAARHGLHVVEDGAQAFTGDGWTGDPGADVSLVSFGPIKTATALGGALVRVRDPQLRAEMRARHASLPVQRRATYLRRVFWYAGLKLLSTRPAYAGLVAMAAALGRDDEALVHGATRGFASDRLLTDIRQQPCAPLLAVLDRRLRQPIAAHVARRRAAAERFLGGLRTGVLRPGHAANDHTHWVVPVLVTEPARVRAVLLDAGFAAATRSSLVVVPPPPDRPELDPVCARAVLGSALFVPAYAGMAPRTLDRVAAIVSAEALLPTRCPPAPSHHARR